METSAWNAEYQKISSLIEAKIQFLEQQEKRIDTQKSDSYNRAILDRINKERGFINSLLGFLISTENLISDLDAESRHLKFQNTLNFLRAEASEKEMMNGYEKHIRNELGIGAEG